ncbi:Glycosyltransferase, GT2 family [Nitrosomonas ureae]|uniref:Glycosyltransferase, GT2 family n=2 Tax=Nitrosomonas ureae TaxID=44577 RepID=A0A1H5UJX2_9PROT|nr:Glycosyltransferase, GT2 family [Nitrosomonas ureae]
MTQTLISRHNDYEGAVLGRTGNFLIGWVRKLSHPDAIITVNLIGDDQWIATARAELILQLEGPQLIMPTEAYGHAFAFNIQLQDWQTIARLETYVANDGYRLPGVVFSHYETHSTHQVHSTNVENYGGLRLWGWAWDILDPDVTQTIYVYEAGRLLAECDANQYCAELDNAVNGHANHGFSLTLPLNLADGCVHKIHVTTAHGQILNGSPISVVSPPATLTTWANALELSQQERSFLTELMERYSSHVPLSLDFSSYRNWLDRFGCAKSYPSSVTSITCAISGDTDAIDTLRSLISQTHPHWTALVCSPFGSLVDARIRYVIPTKWKEHIQSAINQGDSIFSFVISGDTLSTDALSSVVAAFDNSSVQIVYTDCDQIPADGKAPRPWFKPDWDPDLFLAHTPLHHLFATRPGNLPINNPHIGELDAWPWLAVQSVGDNPDAIHHIPRILYHRWKNAELPAHVDAQRSCDAKLAPGLHRTVTDNGENGLAWESPVEWPTVSLIIPTRDHFELLHRCIESLLKTDYPNMEIIVIDNDSVEPDALAYLDHVKSKDVNVIQHPGPFNFSAINNRAVQHTKATLIGFINNDIEAIDRGWLRTMVRHLLRPNVGAVGAKLLWPNGMVQHAGVVLGLHGLVGHTGNNWHKDDAGYFGYNRITRSASAVTAACLLCKREDYLLVNGLDEINFPVNFNDVDFCLKLRSIGKRIVWTPEAQLMHAESASRGRDDTPDRRGRLAREKDRLMQKWHQWITDDPFYNPNLNLDAYSYAGLAIPPRGRATLQSSGKMNDCEDSIAIAGLAERNLNCTSKTDQKYR